MQVFKKKAHISCTILHFFVYLHRNSLIYLYDLNSL